MAKARPRYLATQRAARAVSEALFSRAGQPGGPARSLTARLDFVQAEIADLLHRTGTRARLLFQASLFGVVWLAPLFVRRVRPLGSLRLADRVVALTRMERSAWGSPLVLAVKAVLCILFYEHPESVREIGAGGTCADAEGGATRRQSLPLFGAGAP